MLKDFRQFVLRGNVVDLAVGVIIGAAFNGVVNSLVGDVLTPFITSVVGKPDFKHLSIIILSHPKSPITYGNFLNALVSFLMVATVIFFFVVKPINKINELANRGRTPKAPSLKKCPECLSDIPVKATRCAFCTTRLPAVAAAQK